MAKEALGVSRSTSYGWRKMYKDSVITLSADLSQEDLKTKEKETGIRRVNKIYKTAKGQRRKY
ncbi:hypothetical protein H5T88_09180 [bacterium]|nr:hypothetical protein [bacterium]